MASSLRHLTLSVNIQSSSLLVLAGPLTHLGYRDISPYTPRVPVQALSSGPYQSILATNDPSYFILCHMKYETVDTTDSLNVLAYHSPLFISDLSCLRLSV
ncbi:hypothetical protein J6590_041931 [Homalodisca vitripennis]|nr:hypothetical protein J6590_041931 [Homalodisca vitripennis]